MNGDALGRAVTRREQQRFLAQHEYRDIAVALATDLNRLCDLRANLRDTMAQSPITDGASVTAGLEALYRRMWIAWCNAPVAG